MTGAIEIGLIYAIVALGVYLTFRVLNFPDLTVDGSFTTGGAVAAMLIITGWNPILATIIAFFAGMAAGAITGLLHTKGKIDGLLAGILTMIALWSVNLRIMGLANGTEGTANLGLRNQTSVFTVLRENGLMGTWASIGLLLLGVFVVKLIIDWFLATDLGLALQATGNNEQMIRSFGVNTDGTKILGLSLSNGLVAVGGALFAQYNGFADASMGIGLILIGLASVIIGQAFFGNRWVWLATIGVIVGAIVYRLVIFAALQVGLNPNDMKLITALIVIVALLLPQFGLGKRLGLGALFSNSKRYTVNEPAPATARVETVEASSVEAGSMESGSTARAGKDSTDA